MGCGVTKPSKKKDKTHKDEHKANSQKTGSVNKDSQEEKRQKMLKAAEEREKKLKLKGMTEKSYKEYEEKSKRKQTILKDDYEPLNWN
jgi:hypothetical protein